MARGNVVLADHGQSVTSCGEQPEFLDAPPVVEEPGGCAGAGDPLDPVLREQWLDRGLGRKPLTCRTPYPPDRQDGRAQAARLAAIPGRFLARLRDLWRQASSGTALTAAQIEEVRVVYPDRVLTLVRFPLPEPRTRRPVPAEAQAAALGRLLAEPRLVAARTRWLADLARRARAGLVLSEDQV